MITEHIIWWTGKRTIAYFVIVMGLTCHVCISHEYLSRFNSELYYSLLLILAINRISPMYVVQHLIVRNIQKVSKLKFCRWFIMIQHILYPIDPYLPSAVVLFLLILFILGSYLAHYNHTMKYDYF